MVVSKIVVSEIFTTTLMDSPGSADPEMVTCSPVKYASLSVSTVNGTLKAGVPSVERPRSNSKMKAVPLFVLRFFTVI